MRRDADDSRSAGSGELAADYGSALAITVTLAVAAFLVAMSAALLAARPQVQGLGAFTGLIKQQNQDAKTALYAASFIAILPVSLVFGRALPMRSPGDPTAAPYRGWPPGWWRRWRRWWCC